MGMRPESPRAQKLPKGISYEELDAVKKLRRLALKDID
jgi:hypothetical protein